MDERTKALRTSLEAAQFCRYLCFPLCHGNHWTILIADTGISRWYHYNPLQARGIDPHLIVAAQLKSYIEPFLGIKPTFNLITLHYGDNIVQMAMCPQQEHDS